MKHKKVTIQFTVELPAEVVEKNQGRALSVVKAVDEFNKYVIIKHHETRYMLKGPFDENNHYTSEDGAVISWEVISDKKEGDNEK